MQNGSSRWPGRLQVRSIFFFLPSLLFPLVSFLVYFIFYNTSVSDSNAMYHSRYIYISVFMYLELFCLSSELSDPINGIFFRIINVISLPVKPKGSTILIGWPTIGFRFRNANLIFVRDCQFVDNFMAYCLIDGCSLSNSCWQHATRVHQKWEFV